MMNLHWIAALWAAGCRLWPPCQKPCFFFYVAMCVSFFFFPRKKGWKMVPRFESNLAAMSWRTSCKCWFVSVLKRWWKCWSSGCFMSLFFSGKKPLELLCWKLVVQESATERLGWDFFFQQTPRNAVNCFVFKWPRHRWLVQANMQFPGHEYFTVTWRQGRNKPPKKTWDSFVEVVCVKEVPNMKETLWAELRIQQHKNGSFVGLVNWWFIQTLEWVLDYSLDSIVV